MDHLIDDIIFHESEDRNRYFNAIAPPIIQSSNFAFDDVEAFRKAMANERGANIYGRGNNPTVRIAEEKLAGLQGSEAALLVGSGASAMSLAVLSQVESGDHIICVENPYSWTYFLLTNYLTKFNIDHTFVDGSVSSIQNAIGPNTRLLILESPNSLTYVIQDIKACADLARANNITTIIDNSLATPLYQDPIALGIDIVIHSVSKYINGHSDVVAGLICSSQEIIETIFYNEYMTLGPTVSALNAALILRGLRTLPIRMERISDSTQVLLHYMKAEHRISHVQYPFDPDFPQYDLAVQQMVKGTGLITAEINATSMEQMTAFVNGLQRFKIAVSWGGHESLVLPIVALYGQRGRKDPDVSWKVCRFSVGLEDPKSLISDIQQALQTADIE